MWEIFKLRRMYRKKDKRFVGEFYLTKKQKKKLEKIDTIWIIIGTLIMIVIITLSFVL